MNIEYSKMSKRLVGTKCGSLRILAAKIWDIL